MDFALLPKQFWTVTKIDDILAPKENFKNILKNEYGINDLLRS